MFKFARDTKGNVAMIFALAALPLIVLIGFFIDFGRQEAREQEAVIALDFAVVATAKAMQENSDLSDDELKTIAQTFFDAEISGLVDTVYDPLAFHRIDESEVLISVKGKVKTTIMGLIGYEELSVSAESAAGVGAVPPLELAIVADVSNSMQGYGITALRNAANAMLDELYAGAEQDVKVGLVPFNEYVNIGTMIRGSWLEIPPDNIRTYTKCYRDNHATRAQGCIIRQRCDDSRLVGGGKENCQTYVICPPGKSAVIKCEPATETQTFFGCVKSRHPYPANIQDRDYEQIPVVGELFGEPGVCHKENIVVPLEANPQLIRNALRDLKPEGNTYIPTGLIWGQRLLSPIEPYGQSTLAASRQALVLISDGANSRSVNGSGQHFGKDIDQANDLMIEACDEIKAAGIALYTIDFAIDDEKTKKMLEDCATSERHNFEAKSSAELRKTFMVISRRFTEITLTR